MAFSSELLQDRRRWMARRWSLSERADDGFAYRRQQMVAALRAGGISDERVLQAMERCPATSSFPSWRQQAYSEDVSINIGEGQTISQPWMVALMTEAARILSGCRVLEVGTGSGYQAAVLVPTGPLRLHRGADLRPWPAGRSAARLASASRT